MTVLGYLCSMFYRLSSCQLCIVCSQQRSCWLLAINSHIRCPENIFFLGSWLWSVPSSARIIVVPKPCLIPPGDIYQGVLAGLQKVGHMGTAPNVCLFLNIETIQLGGNKKTQTTHHKQNLLLQQNTDNTGRWQQAQYRPTGHQAILLVCLPS